MINFDLNKFCIKLTCQEKNVDAVTETKISKNELDLYLTANVSQPKFIELNWNFESDDNIIILGDAWERSYGDLEFVNIKDNNRYMPWYFLTTNKTDSFCFGVKTQPNAFVSFKYTQNGISALVDCRNGGCGVHLNGRKIHLATFIFKEYRNAEPFLCLCDYCKSLCDDPILPKFKIYGGNDWYYAYGKNNYDEIVADAKLQSEFAKGIDNPPFMVIDDGWQEHGNVGPWVPNKNFKDMEALCQDIKSAGARPGIWIRFLHNEDKSISSDMRIFRNGEKVYLDPTHPKVQDLIRCDIEKIKKWGYELIKHDFTTVDLFGDYGKDLNETITKTDNWHFYDRTKTNAEIVLDLYRLIKNACGDMIIIGCNTVSHLCAGLVQINRTGDDTSGVEWERTKKMGVNTLAFRLAQNNAFYMVDADCVGILDDKISWDKNRQWLDLLSKSNTALFLSCCKVTDEQKSDISYAFRIFQQDHNIMPIDWYETRTPEKWLIDNEKISYTW